MGEVLSAGIGPAGTGSKALPMSIMTDGEDDLMPETNSSPETGSASKGREVGSFNELSLSERSASVTKCWRPGHSGIVLRMSLIRDQ